MFNIGEDAKTLIAVILLLIFFTYLEIVQHTNHRVNSKILYKLIATSTV
jgi:hypothetical protein